TETYVALKAEIDNWRWAGVPFYLRTGKSLAQRKSEIIIQFKSVPHRLFPGNGTPASNRLVIRLQPDESISPSLIANSPAPRLARGLSFAQALRRWQLGAGGGRQPAGAGRACLVRRALDPFKAAPGSMRAGRWPAAPSAGRIRRRAGAG